MSANYLSDDSTPGAADPMILGDRFWTNPATLSTNAPEAISRQRARVLPTLDGSGAYTGVTTIGLTNMSSWTYPDRTVSQLNDTAQRVYIGGQGNGYIHDESLSGQPDNYGNTFTDVNSPTNAAQVQVIAALPPALYEKVYPAPVAPSTNSVPFWNYPPLAFNYLVGTNSGWNVASANKINDNGAVVATATYSGTATTTGAHGVVLVPLREITDLNGDGTIDEKDAALQANALSLMESDDAKKDGTEYLFPDDTISHGIWSKNDSNAPSGTTDDDNAKQIQITCGATFGSVWFDYTATSGPATITNLVFYKTRACLTADKITFPLAVSPTSPMPTTLYVRMEGTVAAETVGNLVMKLGAADKSQTFCQVSMPLDIVTGYGDPHFFQAANRYILQNNSLHYYTIKTYASGSSSEDVHIVVRREDNSTIEPVDAYNRPAILYGIGAVVSQYPDVDQVINGNLCGTYTGTLFYNRISTITEGRLIDITALNPYRDMAEGSGGPSGWDGRYIATSSPHTFAFGSGVVPITSSYSEAMGGLLNTTALGDNYVTTFIGEAPASTSHKVLFTISYHNTSNSHGIYNTNIVADAGTSGCPLLPGGTTGERTLFYNDGSSSIALALKMAPSSASNILVQGGKHDGTLGYYIHSYLIFDSTKPRP